MIIVADDPDRTERQLDDGELACLDCLTPLAPWGHARPRRLRTRDGHRMLRPRRGRCPTCGTTHVLLPAVALLRRADSIEVIGQALVANAEGEGHRPIAARLGRPPATVRGWLRRFAARLNQTTSHAIRFVIQHDVGAYKVEPHKDHRSDQFALTLLATAVATLDRVFGFRSRSPWQMVSGICAGLLLANTSCPYPSP